jgi:hypothetical protein
VNTWAFQRTHNEPALGGGVGKCAFFCSTGGCGALWSRLRRITGKVVALITLAALVTGFGKAQTTTTNAQEAAVAATGARRANLPPRVVQAERFLAKRGWTRNSANGASQTWAGAGHLARRAQTASTEARAQAQAESAGTAIWQPLGPTAVLSQSFGLVTGRISALALDPSDATGNTLYVGTTGGGVWRSQNADTSSPAGISFIPLTDDLSALSGAEDLSISIGALTVQPGGTGVILAGTGDPNDGLDSYYGAGILRSSDGGTTWKLIPNTVDGIYSFAGEGFAGFAWSTINTSPAACGPNPVQPVVVAAVSQAYEGVLVNAVWPGGSYEGLYYSTDNGENWCLATIADSSSAVVQGPSTTFALPDGNAATSVVWNPVRKLFIAAVRYHGYYQSSDGITWTRLTNQPGVATSTGTSASLSSAWCRTNTGGTGLQSCPIFRGTLAVNPQTGDTFAWTVDINNKDQGIWQDLCAASSGKCTNQTMTFAQPWNTAALEVAPPLDTTIANGDYNLTLAAVPSGQETLLLAGDNDLWEATCPVAQGCKWRNTINSTTCMSAKVGEYQHALAWNAANPMEIFVGNDSGLWRSTDAIAESTLANPEPVCSPTDAAHFQNLNGGLGSLAEVESIAQSSSTPYPMLAGLGANGTAGVSSTTGATADWPEILGGEGGPVAIDPNDSANWYVNNQAGVSIYLGTPPTGSIPGTFNPVLNYTTDPGATTPVATGGVATADVVRDGLSMAVEPPYAPAAFLVDPLNSAQLLIGTCRVWRGPANGVGWSTANAISPILDGVTGENDCLGNALIRTMAAMALPVSTALPSGGEVVYVGMYGSANGNKALAGHVLSMTYNAATQDWSAPVDLTTLGAVTNDTHAMNYYGMDISSIFIDSHDPTGQTVYVTVAGFPTPEENVQSVYGSTSGGASWTALTVNLPAAPANSVVVDPQSASTVYVATDAGVYSTLQIGSCTTVTSGCWAPLGSGLPNAPVVELSAAPASSSVHNLVAATYGRGIWMTPLLGAGGMGAGPATDTLSATTLTFPNTNSGQLSTAQTVTLTNTGSVPLTSIAVSVSGEFQQTNYCTASLAANSSCTISVQFAPTSTGVQNGTLSISDIMRTEPQTVTLSGTGVAPPALGVSPTSLTFSAQVGQPSSAQTVTVTNIGGAPLANVGFQITGTSASSFSYEASTCGATLSNVSGQNSCTAGVVFTPVAAGGATASLVVSSPTAGVAAITVPLSGTGQTPAGLNVNPAQLLFPIVLPGGSSPSQTVSITNTGGSTASSLTLTATLPFYLVQNTCGTSLTAGASCSTGVIFSPSLNGPYTGTLTIASPSLTVSASVPLSGTGGTPGSVQALPGIVNFTSQSGSSEIGVGLTSAPVTVTLTNPDSVNSLGSFALAVTAGFRLASTTCSSTLAAGASCTAVVEFAPTTPGPQSGNLIVTSSALPTGEFVPLSGMGFDFAMTPSGSSSQTIANGQTANYKLVITPLLGSQGVFTFQCSSLPPNSACTFNPASEGIPANVSGNEVVEIATGLTETTAHASQPPSWPVVPLACGLALAPFALKRRRKFLPLAVLLAILASGVTSCTSSNVISGGTVPGSGSGITSPGTFPVVVTATSNGVQHQVTLTLIVD